MPVHFTCPHCTQLLSVGRRKVGSVVMCVTCNGRVLVPQPYEEVPTTLPPDEHTATELAPPPPPVADQFVQTPQPGNEERGASDVSQQPTSPPRTEEPSSVDYERTEQPEPFQQPNPAQETYFEDGYETSPAIRRDTVQISRTILYAIGGLIVFVGLGSFLLGWGMARSLAPVQIKQATRHRVHGNVQYLTRRGQLAPDTQSVVVALPRRKLPDQKFSPETLRPENLSFRNSQDPAVLGIRSLGGDIAITDELGEYELEVGEAGEYFVLILSSHVALPSNKRAISTEIVELGQYFRQADKLLGRNEYVWAKHFVRKAKQIDKVFE